MSEKDHKHKHKDKDHKKHKSDKDKDRKSSQAITTDDIHDFYDLGDTLGKGNFATVKKATRKKDGKHFAVKIIKKSKLAPDEYKMLNDEVDIMHKVDHDNCVRLYEIFDMDKKLYLVLDLLEGGELFDRIVAKGSFSEKQAALVTYDVASALRYLHNIGIVHRDLKPENLIYLGKSDDSPIKLTDFGLAKFTQVDVQALMSTQCGTPGYVAPEILKGKGYGPEVDMWSLGVIVYIMLCGYPPFYAENDRDLYKQIQRAEFDFPKEEWGSISESAKDLVKKLMVREPHKRLSADQVLHHPWLKNASNEALGHGHLQNLSMTNSRNRLRKAINSVIVLNRFSAMLENRFK